MPSGKLSLEEIIEIAIGVERAGAAFYSRLKELAGSGEAKALFARLESDEGRHIRDFEAVLKSAVSRRGGLVYSASQEELLYLRGFASRAVFTSPDQAAGCADALRDALEGIDLALDLEFRSVSFYQDMARIIEDPNDRASILELAHQEREHAASLHRLRDKIAGSR